SVLQLTSRLQELTATASRERTAAGLIRACLPEFLFSLQADAGAVLLITPDRESADLSGAIGYDPELPARIEVSPGSPIEAAARARTTTLASLTDFGSKNDHL